MSWSGTVNCRYCYEQGHNARTCPEKTRHYKQRAEAEVAAGEGREGYWHKQYAKRTGEWLDGVSAKELKKASGRKRRCKYCQKTGHNARTCEELKAAKSNYIIAVRSARAGVWKNLQRMGLGIGALVSTPNNRYYGGENKALWMVQSIHWGKITHESLQSNDNVAVHVSRVSNRNDVAHWDRQASLGLPKLEGMGEDEQMRWSNYEVVGPVPTFGCAPSAEILNAEDIDLKQIFAERQSPDAHNNRWG